MVYTSGRLLLYGWPDDTAGIVIRLTLFSLRLKNYMDERMIRLDV